MLSRKTDWYFGIVSAVSRVLQSSMKSGASYSLLGVRIVKFEMSSRVSSDDRMNVTTSVVDRSPGNPITVIREAAVSTSVVSETEGFSVERVTLAVAVDSDDVLIYKLVPEM